ncbi:3-deoxy-manno-octulosonate cytidylyltransferase [Rheinheimera mesophila]|uniref:3-deoxy-manno-octulosonate cytidylyltransferase n=1 Tax=Rheinheimera mesophila TaxID=1547515 RepID=A0A3P3QR45_9GAMM|nr:3-deoxy-manno-octulosonate cytidylyltransferase [Rheinheimera mesophila]KKL02850.1 3-deoxy-manno-octulosonate cytidylyltransferase [Rheinheimera mesophila]RRJ22920.1 3-deoxy-manno-octulosonate cytidylyltransferase [Rheinheimera mesophila]
MALVQAAPVKTGFLVVIPARYASSRLPGKPLADIAGQTMIERVYRQAMKSGAERVVIATDDARVQQVCEAFGAEVCMTSPAHNSGTERLAEVVTLLGLSADTVVVNVQGDEPFIPPAIIRQVAENLASQSKARMATLAVPIEHQDEVQNPNVVKVQSDKQGYALYFSRSVIPYDRDKNFTTQLADIYRRHLGIYAYRAGFIKDYVSWPASQLEQIECLEQLRVLWQGEAIHVATALEVPAVGVDTPEDLARARRVAATL